MANESINLNLIPKGDSPVIHVSQFDNGRQFNINLLKGSDDYELPAGYTAELHCRKSDRNIVTVATTSVTNNTLTFTTTTQLTACYGDQLCEVSIKDANDYVVGSLNFILAVEKDPLQGGIDSTSEIHDLTEQIEEITTEIVSENYYTKTETDILLDAKADAADVYTKTEVDTALSAKANAADVYTKTQVDTALSAKSNAADVYTKTEVDTALDAKANAADVYTKTEVDTALSSKANAADVYTKTQVDTALSAKANAADVYTKSEVDTALSTKANAADVYTKTQVDTLLSGKVDLEDFILTTGFENETPYIKRQSPDTDGLEYDMLVGGTVAFNQLVESPTTEISVTAGTQVTQTIQSNLTFTAGHKYLVMYRQKDTLTSNTRNTLKYNDGTDHFQNSNTNNNLASGYYYWIFSPENTVSGKSLQIWVHTPSNNVSYDNFNLIDLTAMFGSTIADYVYTLESGTTGRGVTWLKNNGYFTDDYIPYTPVSLLSVKTSKHVMRNANNEIIGEYALDDVELRGILKLDSENNIYYDGDIYESTGIVTRRYEYRAYESGDDSLPDTITDGTNTVTKLATPTTETANPFTNPQIVDANGTEEYIDNRTVPMPVGHDTIYSKATNYRYWR